MKVNFGGSFNFLKYSGPWEYDAKDGEFQNFELESLGNNCTYSHEIFQKLVLAPYTFGKNFNTISQPFQKL